MMSAHLGHEIRTARPVNRWLYRLPLWLMLCALLTTSVGCNKLLANFSLNQAKKRLDEAKTHQADKFDNDGLIATQAAVTAAQQFLDASQNSDARQKAKEAAELAELLLERTIEQRSTFLKSESNRWIGIMKRNDGEQENEILYAKVLAGHNDGIDAFDDQDLEEAIEHFALAVDNTLFLLENLKRQAEDGLLEIDRLKKKLIDEEAEEYYPEGIVEMDGFKERLADLITNRYEYRTAILLRASAVHSAERSVLKTKENKSDRLIRQIENMLADAVSLGAEIHAPKTFESVSDEFENLLKQFYSQQYETVLRKGPELIPLAQALLVETHRASAQAKMDAVGDAIAALDEDKARTYLPGRVEDLERLLAGAQGHFDEENYSATEAVALDALDEERKVVREFDTLTQATIADASAALTIAESVFSTMAEVFDAKVPGTLTGDDLAVEQTKLARKEELDSRVRNARIELGLATLKREDKVFHQAIEISQGIIAASERVAQETYHVVAHNAVHELAAELSRLEREGGRDYTPEAVDRAEAEVANVRDLIATEQYRGAVQSAAEAKAQMEVLTQEMARVAVAKLSDATLSVEQARMLGAETYRQEQIARVSDALLTAGSKLDEANIKSAIQMAEEAAHAADRIGTEAIREWAIEDANLADTVLTRAREAGADRYAAEQLDKASQFRSTAEGFLQAGNYVQAQLTAARAVREADKALFARVIEAEEEIGAAKRYDGWRYDSERLADAIVEAKHARELMEQNQFGQSHRNAESALSTARSVSQAARRESFRDRLAALGARVDMAKTKGPEQFQRGELDDVLREIRNLRDDTATQQYDPERFERAIEKIEIMDSQLILLMESTPDVLDQLVLHLSERLDETLDREARAHTPDLVAQAKSQIRYAKMDFASEDYAGSMANVAEAQRTLDEIELKLAVRDYDKSIGAVFIKFSQILRSYKTVLDMGSTMTTNLLQDPQGGAKALSIINGIDPVEFHQEMTDLRAKTAMIDVPSTRQDLHDDILEMLAIAKKSASKFEKLLIIDQYSLDDAKRIIETAYLDMKEARSRQQALQNELETVTTNVRLVGIERIY